MVKTVELPKDLLRPARFGRYLGRPAVGAFPAVDRIKLAQRLGWGEQVLGRLLRGEVDLETDKIEELARVLGIPPERVREEIQRKAKLC